MLTGLLNFAGGIGLFLLGMSILSTGLRQLGGNRLHRWLKSSTKNPYTGAATGALVTAMLQSSSATTLATMGFISAGLMSFSQGLGLIFGANIGTTLTGWIVALLGFNFDITAAAFPLLFIAVVLRMNQRRPRIFATGKALSGFALLFIGLALMQESFAEVDYQSAIAGLQQTGWTTWPVMLAVGILFTLATQSSSVTVAVSLTALATGVLDLGQVCSVIIGADIGTTGTAFLGTIGTSNDTKRIGYSSIVYNLMTGIIAFTLLGIYLAGVDRWLPGMSDHSPEVVAVAFHTTFNLVGVLVILPFTRPFARGMKRLVPDASTPNLTATLNPKFLDDPEASKEAIRTTLYRLVGETFNTIGTQLERGIPSSPTSENQESDLKEAIIATRLFALKAGSGTQEVAVNQTTAMACALHLLDHLDALLDVVKQDGEQALKNLRLPYDTPFAKVGEALKTAALSPSTPQSYEPISDLAEYFRHERNNFRRGVIQEALSGKRDATNLAKCLDVNRFLRDCTEHAAKVAHYLGRFSEKAAPGM